MSPHSGVLERWGELLPLTPRTPRLSLQEGSTPLFPAPRLAAWAGVRELHLKFEGANPTGSFKDRGMVVAVAKAIEEGARAVLCASTGNTAASAAAYAAHAGITAVVLLPAGKVAAGKLAQAVAYGARVVSVAGNFDAALRVARAAAERYPIALVNSVNPYRIEGQATAAFEICDVLGDAPALLALPVGNGGNITAYGLGFRRALAHHRATRMPRVLGAQAAGAAPLVLGHPVADPETIATAIRIGHPATWEPALAVAHESGGAIRAVSDDEILAAYRQIARLEGIFCEPASAAGVALLRQATLDGDVTPDTRCVCVLTGNGMKDPDRAVAGVAEPETIGADVAPLAGLLGWCATRRN
ncbi:MAG: threonine synthase, partial [Gemmatimonadetes bacterium]|nr:threonine synthase [Gemmatimonadota bacterium]